MNWKKFLLIAVAAGALTFVSAPKSEAHVSVGIGIGFPIGYGYGYPGYYPYGYAYPYAYGYPYSYGYYPYRFGTRVVYRPVVAHRGHRVVHHHPH